MVSENADLPLRDAGRPRRRPVAPSGAGFWTGSTALTLFVLSLFIPGGFNLGLLLLQPYKAILLVMFVPLFLQLVRGEAGPVTAADVLMFLFCFWVAVAIYMNHGIGRVVFIGSNFLEMFGAYMMGRVLIRNATDHLRFFKAFLIGLLFLLPFALVELLLRKRLLLELFSNVMSVYSHQSVTKTRLGFTRVQGPFHNSIHFGFVVSIGFANFFYIYRDNFMKRLRTVSLAGFMVFMSLSSGPFLAVGIQTIMIFWDKILAFVRVRWVLLVLFGIVTLATLEVTLPGGLIGFIVNEVIFNPIGGENRINILKYGSAEILRNPVFGIGLGEWTRPYWQSSTVDNFLLLMAMRYGLPAFAFLVLAIGISAIRIMSQPSWNAEVTALRTGYMIGLTGLTLVLGTVHIWGQPLPLLMAYIGMGAWFYNGTDALAHNAPRRQSQVAGARRSVRPARGAQPDAPVSPGAVPDSVSADPRAGGAGRRRLPTSRGRPPAPPDPERRG